MSEAYPTLYTYTSNHNIGNVPDPREDTIAIFENVNDELTTHDQVYAGPNQVRGMVPGDSEEAGFDDEACIAGAKVFKRTDGNADDFHHAQRLMDSLRTLRINVDGLTSPTQMLGSTQLFSRIRTKTLTKVGVYPSSVHMHSLIPRHDSRATRL